MSSAAAGEKIRIAETRRESCGSGLLLPIHQLHSGLFSTTRAKRILTGRGGAGAGAGRGGQQFKMLVLPSPDRPLLPGPRPEKKLEKVVGGSGENTLK